jgi:hypothetical protein
MPSTALVSVIVVNWNGKEYLGDCFTSLSLQTHSPLEFIMVDNGSVDESVECVKERFPQVKVIENASNLGFGAAVNAGLKRAKGEYILFLNNDLYLKKDCIEEMLKLFITERCGAVVPKILLFKERDTINSFGVVVNFLGLAYPKYIWLRDRQDMKVEETACGGIFLLRKDFMDKLGGFDEDFFMYHEDHDLSWRIRLQGERLLVNPKAVLYHKYQFSRNPDKFYYSEKNRLQLLLKNYSLKTLLLISPALIMVELAEICFSLTSGWFWKKIGSYGEILSSLPRLREKRKIIQKERRVSDQEIVKLFGGELKISGVNHFLLDKVLNPFLSFYWGLIRGLI